MIINFCFLLNTTMPRNRNQNINRNNEHHRNYPERVVRAMAAFFVAFFDLVLVLLSQDSQPRDEWRNERAHQVRHQRDRNRQQQEDHVYDDDFVRRVPNRNQQRVRQNNLRQNPREFDEDDVLDRNQNNNRMRNNQRVRDVNPQRNQRNRNQQRNRNRANENLRDQVFQIFPQGVRDYWG